MRLAWMTDIHMNFFDDVLIEQFNEVLWSKTYDALVITGDIAESKDIEQRLAGVAAAIQRPVYFVLGNHDFYYGSVPAVRAAVGRLCESEPDLHYLSQCGAIELTPKTALVGHDGWGDGRYGDYDHSDVLLNDYRLIEGLACWDKLERKEALARFGDEAGEHLARVLDEALPCYARLIVATHVPPFAEACRYENRPADDNWLPHFSCRATGDVLRAAAIAHPDREILVLCGHTHHAADVQPQPNLRVLVGGAEYFRMEIQQVLEVE